MSSHELRLFLSEKLSFKEKFFHLMNLLVINHSYHIFENYLFFMIFTCQNLSVFITKSTGQLNYKNSMIDNFLYNFGKILRLKSLLFSHRKYYNLFIYFTSFYYVFFTIFFIFLISKTTRKSTYTLNLQFLNFFIKVNIYVLNNITIDFFTRMLCFGSIYNQYIPEIKCDQSNNFFPVFISGFTTIYSSILTLFIQLFYEENFLISDSKFNTITSKIYIYQHIISIISSIELSFINQISNEFFYITNIIMSIFLFFYYIKRLVYYNLRTNIIYGSTYFLNVYTSIYFCIFYFLGVSNQGLIYILSSIFIIVLFGIIFNNLINKIVRKTPYHKIENNYFLLFYTRYIIDLINNSIDNQESKSLLNAIIEIHALECPNKLCLTKNNKKIYLPVTNEWSHRNLIPSSDQIYLKNFIPIVLKYFISISKFTPELLLNLSYYYLIVIGNYCLSLYYYNRAKEIKLNLEEHFLLVRLKILISEKLFEEFKEEGENCFNLKEMNPTLYFKYKYISEKFIEEIEKDIELSIEFWEIFSFQKNSDIIKFSSVFNLIEKIKNSKNNILTSWNNLFHINSLINPIFDIYLDYINEINDDSNLKNKLDSYKRKKEINGENFLKNYYSLLFSKETGLIIINGSNGKEGIIEKANFKFGKIFDVNYEKVRGRNINEFMPKIFSSIHSKFIRKYFEIGEKKILDKGKYKTYATDFNRNIIQIQLYLKLFPVINDNILFISMINLDKINDIIILDSNFIIQGMSKKLNKYFNINNPNLFYSNEIPFYMICRNFIGFYKTFFKEKKKKNLYSSKNISDKKDNNSSNNNSFISNNKENEYQYLLDEEILEKKEEKKDIIENIEVNENMEIEYQIKFPEFLSQFSYYSNNYIRNNSYESSNVSIEEETKIKDLNIEEEIKEKSDKLQYLNYHSKSFKPNNFSIPKKKESDDENIIFISPKLTHRENPFSPVREKKNRINYQINGIKFIFLYKSLFNQEKFTELETLFDENTIRNYISLKFNFSFEKFNFSKNKFYYIVRCIDNNKKIEEENNSNLKNNITPILNNNIIVKNKIKPLKKIYKITKEEKKKIKENLENFSKLIISDLNLKKYLNESTKEIKSKSKIHGEHTEKNKEEQSQLNGENISQTSNSSSFINHLSKLNRIIESRNKILSQNNSSIKMKYLKILPFFLLFVILIFYFLYNSFYNKTKKELIFLRKYNNIVYSVQITMTLMLNDLIDLLFIIYSNALEIEFNLSNFNTIEEYILSMKKNISISYSESNKNIIFLERYINKYIKDTKNRIWIKLPFTYYFLSSFQDYQFFPLIAKISLYDTYEIFHINNLHNLSLDDLEEFTIINYNSFNAINGVINLLLPKLIYNMTFLLEDFMTFSDKQFIKFRWICFCFLIFFIFIYLIMIFITCVTVKQLNYGINKLTKINQENIESTLLKIKNFRNTLRKKIFQYQLKSINNLKDNYSYMKGLNFTFKETKNNSSLIDSTKNSQLKSSISISNNFSFFKKQKIKQFSFPNFIILFYFLNNIILFIFLLFIYFLPKELIKNNSNLLKTHSYILQIFLYITTILFKMKSLFIEFFEIEELDLTLILNETLSSTFYDNLPKFKDLYDFYYKGYLIDTCRALYDFNTENYFQCYNNSFIKLTNNTNSIREYLEKEIESLTNVYKYYYNSLDYFEPLFMFTLKEYQNIIVYFKEYFIPVHSRFDNILYVSFENKAKEIKFYSDCLFYFMFIWIGINIFYQIFFYIPYFEKMLIISIHFIQVIPSNIILNTPELENWLEKAEHK